MLIAAITNDAPGDVITWASLLTVAGASGAAAAFVAFLRIFRELSPARSRQLAAIFGVVVVEVAVKAVGHHGWPEYGLGLIVGVQAGLAASKTIEVIVAGWNHEITRNSGSGHSA